jgi:hypothetical protein
MQFDHVPARTVRFWAWVDSSVSWPLAIPPLASRFLRILYHVNAWLGGAAAPPEFAPIHLFFVCLSGVLIGLWVIVRLVHPVGVLALADASGRMAVAALIGDFLIYAAAPPVLALFILTEVAGAAVQFAAVVKAQHH